MKLAVRFRRRVAAILIFDFCLFSSASPAHRLRATPDLQIFIRINQLGYHPRDPKIAIVFSRKPLSPKFNVRNAVTNAIEFEGAAKSVSGRWAQFDHHAELDFSTLRKTGTYLVEVEGTQSPQFEIGINVYAELPDELLEFMREQRCGYNPFLDAVCHSFDGRTAFGPRPAGTYLDATGGWHDAGRAAGRSRVVYFADGKPQGLRQYLRESTGVANLAGRYAAAMALGYQIWKNVQRMRDYAAKLLREGREVYALGKAKEGVQQGNSYGAPYRYEETTWADDMEWGAAELFRATGERNYLTDAIRYAKLAADESWMGKEQTKHYQYYPFMNLGHFRLYELVDRNMRKILSDYYRSGLERCARAAEKNPYRIGVPFIWCSNNLVVALATQAVLYERMTGDKKYEQLVARQVDWLLGRNPWGFSMFTEIPTDGVFPRDVHLMTNSILKRPIRGGLVD